MKQPVVSATAHRGPRAEALPRMKSTSTAEHLLTPRMREVLERIRRAKVPAYHTLSPKEARWAYNSAAEILDLPRVPLARVQDLDIPGAGNAPLRARLYAQSHERLPVLLYLHGGGFTIGGIETHDSLCRQLAQRSGAAVVSLAYRLAPEHRFPTAVDDSFAALQWLASQAGELGLDGSRLAVGGDSAGGTLAAVVALMARDAGGPRIACQALVYPATAAGVEGPYPSRERHALGPTLTLRTMGYFMAHYFGPEGRAPDFRGAPVLAADLSRLPPALLQVAAHDPLRDEILDYASRLMAAGTEATVVEYHGLAHGFISMGGAIGAARLAQLQLAAALRGALGS